MTTPSDSRRSTGSLHRQRCSLPIFTARGALLREFRAHDCSVVVGETGSGKTTQIPQYLLETGFVKKGGGIAVTQPRRVAATSVAQRVAEERGVELGGEVGYSVRFDDCSSLSTKLKFMTDGMLLREAILDPQLMKYNVVVLDEAHERTVHTDLLFGIVKSAHAARAKKQLRKLRIIVMSATLAAEDFSSYFNGAKILYIQGRQFPVTLHYTLTPQEEYTSSAITTILQLHEEQVDKDTGDSMGDILVFLTGRDEIESVQDLLLQCSELFPPHWLDVLVCPLFAALPSSQQNHVFQPSPQGSRKVILSTNIAETSITIPGVRYVVDSGKVKARGYSAHDELDLLTVVPVSKAQARQRAGRAGRVAAGHCYRLYTQQHFEELIEDTVPEILRCSLLSVILQLLALGVTNILNFDFMVSPPKDSVVRAIKDLFFLGAIEQRVEDEGRGGASEGKTQGRGGNGVSIMNEEMEEDFGLQLTSLGWKLSHFPLEPTLAKAILSSQEFGCTHEVISVVSMLSVDSVTFTPRNKKDAVNAAHRKFLSEDGDHLTLLNIYRAYKNNKGNRSWCKENFIHIRNMRIITDVRRQLHELCDRVGVEVTSGGVECSESLRKSLLRGLFGNVAEHVGEGKYRTMSTRQEVFIHPSSCLFHIKPHPPYLMYSEIILTSKCYMRNVSVIESEWLQQMSPFLHNKIAATKNVSVIESEWLQQMSPFLHNKIAAAK